MDKICWLGGQTGSRLSSSPKPKSIGDTCLGSGDCLAEANPVPALLLADLLLISPLLAQFPAAQLKDIMLSSRFPIFPLFFLPLLLCSLSTHSDPVISGLPPSPDGAEDEKDDPANNANHQRHSFNILEPELAESVFGREGAKNPLLRTTTIPLTGRLDSGHTKGEGQWEKGAQQKRGRRAAALSEYDALNDDFVSEYDALNLDFNLDDKGEDKDDKELEVPAREFEWEEGHKSEDNFPPKEWWDNEEFEMSTVKPSEAAEKQRLMATKLLEKASGEQKLAIKGRKRESHRVRRDVTLGQVNGQFTVVGGELPPWLHIVGPDGRPVQQQQQPRVNSRVSGVVQAQQRDAGAAVDRDELKVWPRLVPSTTTETTTAATTTVRLRATTTSRPATTSFKPRGRRPLLPLLNREPKKLQQQLPFRDLPSAGAEALSGALGEKPAAAISQAFARVQNQSPSQSPSQFLHVNNEGQTQSSVQQEQSPQQPLSPHQQLNGAPQLQQQFRAQQNTATQPQTQQQRSPSTSGRQFDATRQDQRQPHPHAPTVQPSGLPPWIQFLDESGKPLASPQDLPIRILDGNGNPLFPAQQKPQQQQDSPPSPQNGPPQQQPQTVNGDIQQMRQQRQQQELAFPQQAPFQQNIAAQFEQQRLHEQNPAVGSAFAAMEEKSAPKEAHSLPFQQEQSPSAVVTQQQTILGSSSVFDSPPGFEHVATLDRPPRRNEQGEIVIGNRRYVVERTVPFRQLFTPPDLLHQGNVQNGGHQPRKSGGLPDEVQLPPLIDLPQLENTALQQTTAAVPPPNQTRPQQNSARVYSPQEHQDSLSLTHPQRERKLSGKTGALALNLGSALSQIFGSFSVDRALEGDGQRAKSKLPRTEVGQQHRDDVVASEPHRLTRLFEKPAKKVHGN